jgi:hypothetical protein
VLQLGVALRAARPAQRYARASASSLLINIGEANGDNSTTSATATSW